MVFLMNKFIINKLMKAINSISEAFHFLHSFPLNSSHLRFRGQSNLDWPLTPSIYRYLDFKRYQAIIHERDLLRERPPFPMPPMTYTTCEIEWLMACQHNGVPTRLLDWTSDILIALFFGCFDVDNLEKDGALFVCNHYDYPQFDLYHDKLIKEKQLSFVNTNLTNPKMRFQSGCFMLWGASPLDESSTESYDLWKYLSQNRNSIFFEKLMIPQKSKRKILKELNDIYAINDENIFVKGGNNAINIGYFHVLRQKLRLMSLYQTNSGYLTPDERKIARSFFQIDCENWLRECIRLVDY